MRASDVRPLRHVAVLQRETVVPQRLDETFAFFSDASNLEKLTPPWLNFTILTPQPVVMHEGAIIDYRIVLYGVPIAWKTRIDAWEPGVRFVDRQISGPYLWWRHEHRFEATQGGTRVIDRVEYVPRLGWLTGAFVRRDVERIFAYRQAILPQLLTTEATTRR